MYAVASHILGGNDELEFSHCVMINLDSIKIPFASLCDSENMHTHRHTHTHTHTHIHTNTHTHMYTHAYVAYS